MTNTRMAVVYRCFDATDRLVYIGSTGHPERRLIHHRSQVWWYSLVARISYEVHDDIESARSAEWAAIADEAPAFNVAQRPGRPSSQPFPLSDADAAICRGWAKDRSAYLPMPYRWVRERQPQAA